MLRAVRSLSARLLRRRTNAIAGSIGPGHVDFYGYHSPSGAWIFCGWLATQDQELDSRADVKAIFEDGEATGSAVLSTYSRPDLSAVGVGVVVCLDTAENRESPLVSLTLHLPRLSVTITPNRSVGPLQNSRLSDELRAIVPQLADGSGKDRTAKVAARAPVSCAVGTSARDRIFLEIDVAIACSPHDLVVAGWLLAEPGPARTLRIRCGSRVSDVVLDQCIRVDRPDVLNAVGAANGFHDLRCGFVGFVPNSIDAGHAVSVELEDNGEVVQRSVQPSRMAGMDAIHFLLNLVDLPYGDVAAAYDRVLGPSITLLNAERLRSMPLVRHLDLGPQPPAPVLSVIVSLYGRLDFMDYQFGFFSRRASGMPVEFIYVLDEPGRLREAEQLATSIYERFRIPFRLVSLARNVGFGPANNIGLELARGEYVCFMNSDVFPGSDGWMEGMVNRLRDDDRLGAVAPLLLFEDDSVQHAGMTFEALAEFGGWHFPIHPRKGWRRPRHGGLLSCSAITGACLVMRSETARELGGFDERYVIGDFEDADLCLRLRERGLTVAVDLDVHLYHLERQSQAGSGQRWRMNLTLFNAWTHERRWAATLNDLMNPCPLEVLSP